MTPLDAALKWGLFQLDPEASHHAALKLLSMGASTGIGRAVLHGIYGAPPVAPVHALGLSFPNAVGLAAGYDKNAVAWKGLAQLGFGHVEIGTVTPMAQGGNPLPRVFRLADDRCVINRLGFPSEGAAAVLARLDDDRPHGMILGVNIGKNKETPNEEAGAEYASLIHTFAEAADYLAVNVSSPNTPGLRALQRGDAISSLLAEVAAARAEEVERLGRPVPIVVKLSPDLDDEGLEGSLQAISDHGVDGIVATNTTLSRAGVNDPQRDEKGGLSGAALTARSLATVEKIRARIGDDLPIFAVGGIMTPDDAKARIDAGATLVQLYTGVVYGGPGLVKRVVAALGS